MMLWRGPKNKRGSKRSGMKKKKRILVFLLVLAMTFCLAACGGGGSASGSKTSSIKVSPAEKKLLELYRKADTETKKAAVKLLKGEGDEDAANSILEDILGVVQDMLENR